MERRSAQHQLCALDILGWNERLHTWLVSRFMRYYETIVVNKVIGKRRELFVKVTEACLVIVFLRLQ